MKKEKGLFLVKDHCADPVKSGRGCKTYARAQDDSHEVNHVMSHRRPALSLEEHMRLFPGKFINGHEDPEGERITAFILPMRSRTEPPESLADKEDWDEFDRNEVAQTEVTKNAMIIDIPPVGTGLNLELCMGEYWDDHLSGLQEQLKQRRNQEK
jgi:hypothetical protein